MKLRNKKTGEIVSLNEIININDRLFARLCEPTGSVFKREIKTLFDLFAEWEDYEESKEIYYINYKGHIMSAWSDGNWDDEKSIGNYFETREEAEKAVEKLKAWKRLKDKGFRFEGYDNRDRANGGDIVIHAHVDTPHNNLIEDAQPSMLKDLDLLFGGEE